MIARSFFLLYLLFTLLLISCARKTVVQNLSFPSEIPNILIHDANSFVGPCEPTICINPSNPRQIMAGSVLDNFYLSEDGGKTWSKSKLTSSLGVYGDPVVRMDTKGNIYFAHLSNPTGNAYVDDEFLDRIVVQKSSDAGKTWNNGTHPDVRGIKDQDKQWTFIHPETGVILMTWTEFDKYGSKAPSDKSRILFSQSMDEGETWSPPLAISQLEGDCIDDDMTTEGAVPVIDLDGNYHVTWSYDNKIYYDRSEDQGISWLENDPVIAQQPEGWSIDIPGIGRCNGMPILDCDYSNGPHRGRLYMNWSDQRNGIDDTDIWLKYSDDQGQTWSAPIRVNDDGPGNHQFFTWMDIDPITGFVYVVFYDRRNTEGNATDVYLAYSKDGGNTFINKKISEASFTPNELIFFGDYNDISAYDNMVRPIWTSFDQRTKKLSVWTALIDMKEE